MQFLSIKEFFYKLNTIGFILLLVPLLVFTFLYSLAVTQQPDYADDQSLFLAASALLILGLGALTVVNWVAETRLKKYLKRPELTGRMDGYGSVTILKMTTFCFLSILSAAAFYFTGHVIFTVVFLLMVIFVSFQWPTPARLCKALGLQGSEKEMVMKNLDTKK